MNKKYFSKKYSKIIAMNGVLNATSDSDKLMIHTANGIYIGKLKENTVYENFDIQPNDDFQTFFHKTYQKAIKDNPSLTELQEIPENFITIELEDVTLLSDNSKIKIPFVEIFVDQIIGFSAGSLN